MWEGLSGTQLHSKNSLLPQSSGDGWWLLKPMVRLFPEHLSPEFQACCEAQFSTAFSSDENMLLCAVQYGCYWSHVATELLTDG